MGSSTPPHPPRLWAVSGRQAIHGLQYLACRAGQSLARREAMLSFCSLAGAGAILIWGAKGSKDAKLPITIGPQQPAQVGPRGR